jgi:hypothetical protein
MFVKVRMVIGRKCSVNLNRTPKLLLFQRFYCPYEDAVDDGKLRNTKVE